MPSEQPWRLDSLLWCLSCGGSEAPDVEELRSYFSETKQRKQDVGKMLNKKCGFLKAQISGGNDCLWWDIRFWTSCSSSGHPPHPSGVTMMDSPVGFS